jgi:hypothetical protein
MKNRKLLIVSAAVALAAGGIAIGGTYALFTSGASNNVAVTAGKVSITSAKTLVSAESMGVAEAVSGNAATFANGGSVSIVGDKIVLDKMTPGDKVTVHLVPANNSNVKIKYRSVVAGYGLLVPGLKVTLGGAAVSGGVVRSDWVNLDAGAALSAEQDLVIELPEEAGNQYQEQSASFSVNYEAIQQNADVSESAHLAIDDAAKTGTIYDEEGFELFGEKCNAGNQFAGYTFTLARDLDMSYANWTPIGKTYEKSAFSGILDGASHKISNLLIEGIILDKIPAAGGPVQIETGIFNDLAGGSIKNLTVDNAYVKGQWFVGVLAGDTYASKEVYENVTITNCTVIGSHYVGGVVGYAYGAVFSKVSVADSSVFAAPDMTVANEYDDGDKIGGVIGFKADAVLATGDFTEVSVTNTKVRGYRDIGGIAGLVQDDSATKGAIFTNCKTDGLTLTADQSVNFYAVKAANVGDMVGRVNTSGTITYTGCTNGTNVKSSIAQDGTVTNL